MWKDFPEISGHVQICEKNSILEELNNETLLKELRDRTLYEIGIPISQTINVDYFLMGLEKVLVEYVKDQKINSNKVNLLVSSYGSQKAYKIIACGVLCLMQSYELVSGPKIGSF